MTGSRTTAADRPRATVDDYRITNEAEFQRVTRDPHRIAAAYFYQQLDCLVAYAHKVAADFFRRPQLYTDLTTPAAATADGAGPDRTTIAPLLARLRAGYGHDERVPSQEQRDEIYSALFGAASVTTAGNGDFARLRDELIGAAAAFAERVFDTGEEMLRERVRTTHRPFKDYLIGLQGDALAWSTDETLAGITGKLAYPILRTPGVTAVFGVPTPPREQWPFTEDPNADKLIEQISKHMSAEDAGHPTVTREIISNRQRAALRGAEALATSLDFSEEGASGDDLDHLITKCYTWGSALKSLTPPPVGPPSYLS
jgi:hypothetical protein